MLSKDNISSYKQIWTPHALVAETNAHPKAVLAIAVQDDEQASGGTENQRVTSSDRLQVKNDAPPHSTSPDIGLDAVTRTSSTHSSGCLDLKSPPSILVTFSVHGDNQGQLGSASRSNKDVENSATISTGDTPSCASNATLSQSSASSLRTLSDTQSSVTLLNLTPVAPPRRIFKGSSLRISRTYSDSTEDSVVNDPDHLRIPSLDARSHSAPPPAPNSAPRKSFLTQTSPTAMSWLTDKSYGITPPFTRLAINAPGVVLPFTVREYQRHQHLKEFEKMHKEDVVDGGARSKLSSAVPFSIDRFHGTAQPTTCGISARSLDDNTLVPMDSSSFPRIFGNRTEINQRVVVAEEIHVPTAAQPLQQHGCTCEAGRSCLCRRTFNHRTSKIRRKESEEGSGAESKGVGNKRTGTTSVLMKIVSKFNRSTSPTG